MGNWSTVIPDLAKHAVDDHHRRKNVIKKKRTKNLNSFLKKETNNIL